MASEEDNFDIDIYGDGGGDLENDANGNYKQDEEHEFTVDAPDETGNGSTGLEAESSNMAAHQANGESKIPNSDGASHDHPEYPKQAPQQQGLKRKEGSDERILDSGASTAILISDLHWWITEDDIRGWANQAGCEDELKDVTFSEHKVNGKSKG